MIRSLRLIGALFAFLVAVLFMLAAGAAVIFVTDEGQAFVSRQTQDAVSRILGPNYNADLGAQSIALRADGSLAVEWEGVSLRRIDRPEAPTSVRRVALALRLRPLLSGKLALGALEIDGARVDVTAFGAPDGPSGDVADKRRPTTSIIARTVTSGVAVLERQLEALRTLQFETVSFSDIAIEGIPRLSGEDADASIHHAELTRDGDGSLSFETRLRVGRVPLDISGDAGFDGEGSLVRLFLQSELVDLGAIVPPGPANDVLDTRPFATDADIGFTLDVGRDLATRELVSQIAVRGGPGHVQVGRNHTSLEAIDLRFSHRSGLDRLVLERSPIRFDGVAFEATGIVEPDTTRSGNAAVNRLRFRFGSDEVRSALATLGAEPGTVTTASVWAEGTFSARRRQLDLERLTVEMPDGTLTGAGVARYGSPLARTAFAFESERLSTASVKAFWPFNFGGGARRWVLQHVGQDAVVSNARIGFDMSAARMASAFRPDGFMQPSELTVDLTVADATVALPGHLPTVEAAAARVETRGSVTAIEIEGGTLAGGTARLAPSSVHFRKVDGVRDWATSLSLDLNVTGPAAELLSVAAAEPINALRSVPIDPATVAGSASVAATTELWFGPTLPRDQFLQGWAVSAELLDVTPSQPIEGQRFANLTGPVTVEPGLLGGELSGTFNTLPARIDLQIPFGAAATAENRVEIDLSLSEDDAHDLVPSLADYLSGPTKAKIVRAAGALTATVELTGASLSIPTLAWRKGPGVRATVETAVERNGETTRLNGLRLTGDGFSARGSAVIDGGGLRRLDLGSLSLNPDDDVALALERTGDQLSVTVSGKSFDARPLIENLRAGIGQAGGGGPTLDVFASIDRLRGFNGQTVAGFDLNYASENGRTAAMSLTGSLGGSSLGGDLSPRGSVQSVRLQTRNLGALLGFAGVYARMEGGAADLDLQGTPADGYSGRLRTRDFTLVDEPRLDNIVGSSSSGASSLSQAVGRDLRTSRAYFDQASVDLSYRGGRLLVSNGIIRGPIFGSSFEGLLQDSAGRIDIAGSFMPAYGINRLFGSIPIVGQILGNGNEGGLLGITYRLSGAFASPTLTVNPLSIIAPGVFRQIFEY